MADATPRTFFSGASLVWSRQRVLWLIYAANFVLANVATRGTNERIAVNLDHSLAASQLVHGFNLGAFGSLATNSEFPFSGSVSASLLGAVLFTIFTIFATGGILATYYSGQRLHAGGFFEACGHHFWRYVRLTIYILIVLTPFSFSAESPITSTIVSTSNRSRRCPLCTSSKPPSSSLCSC
jgi:hypothetical protein